MNAREQEVLEAVERRRRLAPKLKDELVTLAHGAGGKATRALVEALFLEELGNPLLGELGDAAVFAEQDARLALTTDAFVVDPLFFPGGDIGSLAVHGTVNDLAVAGARPVHLAAAFVVEEGFPTADLRRIAASMGAAARAAGVTVVAGDTKVVEKGKADGLYVSVAGVGVVDRDLALSIAASLVVVLPTYATFDFGAFTTVSSLLFLLVGIAAALLRIVSAEVHGEPRDTWAVV